MHSRFALGLDLRSLVPAVFCALGMAGTAAPHHSPATLFDMQRTVTVEGSVKEVEWTNPHVQLYIESEGTDGKPENFAIMGAAPNLMQARAPGLRDNLKPGVRVTVSGYPTKQPVANADSKYSRMIYGGQIQLAEGAMLPFGNGPPLGGSAPGKTEK
jgi:hypothetical protein